MTNISNVSNVSTTDSSKDKVKISSIEDMKSHPEFFPVWMEEIQRKNLSMLLSTSSSEESSSDTNSLFGMSTSDASSSDPLSSLGITGLSSSSDPMSSLFSSQGVGADMSFMNPTSTLQSVQVQETLKGLSEYSNLKETKQWLNQVVNFVDPADKVARSGRVTKMDIENVYKPVFTIDDKYEVTLEDIKSLNAEAKNTNTNLS